MRKQPVQAIPYNRFHQIDPRGSHHGVPPAPHETLIDRLFTALAHASGLHHHARKELVKRIQRIETSAGDLKAAARIQHHHQQLNLVVDGGWLGLWTSLRISLGAA